MEQPRSAGPARRSALATFHQVEAEAVARPDLIPATDVEYIIGLGHSRDVVIAAMTTTRGDKAAALDILRRGGAAPSDSSWRSELKDDFTSGLTAVPLPNSVENRALWKSPLYVRVGEPRARDGRTFYQTSVVRKDGQAWKLEKAYSDFLRLKNKLPLFSTNNFKNQFPAKNDVAALFGSVNTELRRRQLEEWMRELCLDEECMRNEEILRALNVFVEGDSHNSPAAVAPHSPPPNTNSRYKTDARDPFTGIVSPPPASSVAFVALTSAAFVASLPEVKGPLTYQELQSSLPFKIPLLDARHRENNETGKDSSDAQLVKDYSRDRIIVQGKRLEGSSSTIPQIVLAMKDAVSQLLVQNNKQPLSSELSSSFFTSLLKKMSRTESAFLCHSAFCQLLLEEEGDQSASGDAQHPPPPPTPFPENFPKILVVPESQLAEPIRTTFHIKSREGTGEWCLQADCEAGTSFRVNDAESEDVTTLLQVKVTWHKVMFAMPKFATECGVAGPVVCELSEKEGKGFVVAERDTRSTSRDWRA